jgi:hypothetical protein
VVWVFGQLLHYLTHPRPHLRKAIMDRVQLVLPGVDPYDLHSPPPPVPPGTIRNITIAVHVRGGVPDYERKPTDLGEVMRVVDAKVAEHAQLGERVTRVFMCSDTQDTNIRSVEHMTSHFPRSFEYVILPHYNYSTGTEAEYVMRDASRSHSLSHFDVFVEYWADVMIMAYADVYVGSGSSVYILAAGIRLSRTPWRNASNTGYLDTRFTPSRWFQEGACPNCGTILWHQRLGGFDNGTVFW